MNWDRLDSDRLVAVASLLGTTIDRLAVMEARMTALEENFAALLALVETLVDRL